MPEFGDAVIRRRPDTFGGYLIVVATPLTATRFSDQPFQHLGSLDSRGF